MKSLVLKRGILRGVFFWDMYPPKQPMSLGSSGIEGWVPLRDGRRILFACPAAVWPQTQQRLAQPVETDNAKSRGWLWEICCSVLFCPEFPGGFTCRDQWEAGFPAGSAGTSVGSGCLPSAAGWERGAGRHSILRESSLCCSRIRPLA